MAYKWKPTVAQRKAFAEKMKDPNESAAYYAAKIARTEKARAKRRAGSQYDYNTAGGEYVPTKEQHDFCAYEWPGGTDKQENARNMVLSAYVCNEKTHHDNIHVINEMRRAACTI